MELNELFYKSLLDNLHEGVYFVDCDRKIRYWNSGAERITGYKKDEVLDRPCSDNILMHIDEAGAILCAGACPLVESTNRGRTFELDIYLHHKEGHRIPVRVWVTPIRDANRKIIGSVEIFSDNSSSLASQEIIKDLEKQAYIDHLTGVANRRFTEMQIHSRLEGLRRYNWFFGLLFIDVNRLKTINDYYGHDAGDLALKMVANTLVKNSRSFDVIGRWGGDEFVAIIPNVDESQLDGVAGKYKNLVAQSSLTKDPHTIRVGISVGATLARPDDTIETIVKRADKLMYQRKPDKKPSVQYMEGAG